MPSSIVEDFLRSARYPKLYSLDSFALEELKREFTGGDRQGRIRTLRRAYANLASVPFELAAMAVGDSDQSIRAWLARNGRSLDYSYLSQNRERDTENLELDLETRLKEDSDEFVRACALSNCQIYKSPLRSDDFMNLIASSSQMERLGLMQNSEVVPHLAADLYDLSKDFGITVEERAALLEALLNNEHFLEDSKYTGNLYRANKDIWENAIGWSEEYLGLVMHTFERIDTADATKIETYRRAPKLLRLAILAGCENRRGHRVVEEIGLSEKDDDCRELAFAVVPWLESKTLWSLFKAKDRIALFGLAQNRSLPRSILRTVYEEVSKLKELHDEYGPHGVIRDLRNYISEDPDVWAKAEKIAKGKRNWIIVSEMLIGIFKLTLVAAAFLVTDNSAQLITLAILILVYTKLDQTQWQVHALAIANHENMLRLKRKLGISTNPDARKGAIGIAEEDDYGIAFAELQKNNRESSLVYIVQMIFRALAVIAAILLLVKGLLSQL